MNKKTYSGWLSVRDYGESSDVLFISSLSDPFAEELEWMAGKQVCVRYWITDKEATLEAAQEQFIKRLFGAADVEFFARYSDITGYLWTDENLKVGGHDLLEELKSSEGLWLILEVEQLDV